MEIVVALTLTAAILALATGSLLRQQRTAIALRAGAEAGVQLRMGTALLPAQLGLAALAWDDLVSGELRDTALQLRVPVAAALACDSGTVPAIALDEDTLVTTGLASLPRRGDSLWWYRSDSARWIGREVGDVRSDSASCGGAHVGGPGARHVMHLPIGGGDTVPRFAPLRVTRQTRLVIYRAGDGTWQLGLREWSDATHSMASPQPVAGPFVRIADDGVRTGFRYYDRSDAELHPDADTAAAPRVARIRFTASVLQAPLPAGVVAPAVRDSVDVAVRPRVAP